MSCWRAILKHRKRFENGSTDRGVLALLVDWNNNYFAEITMPDPWKIVQTLVDAGLRVLVIGGHAVNFHGHIRATEDVDVMLLPDVDWQARLLGALTGLNAYILTDEIDPETKIERIRPVTEADIACKQLIMVGFRTTATSMSLRSCLDYLK